VRVHATAPGRVNLIGDHTDYTGGLVMPMAIDLAVTIDAEIGGTTVDLSSSSEQATAAVDLAVTDPRAVTPPWARYVAGVVAQMSPTIGLSGTVRSTLPAGAGLSSSAALEIALALALGFEGTPLELAQLCRRAEHAASGVPCGIMDQLASAAGVAGHALLIDCRSLTVSPVEVPEGCGVVVVHSGLARTLAGSAYAQRVAECAAAEEAIGPLRDATLDAACDIADPAVRRRARHVISENQRVREFAEALSNADLAEAGALMAESHRSLAGDFEVSVPELDELVARLQSTAGVFGARMTGGGFGGCVVALCEPGALAGIGWHVTASAGARREFTT
jgi:galactokinase